VIASSLIGRSTSWKSTSLVSWNVNQGKQQGLGFKRVYTSSESQSDRT
jgi:hypothetical protein